MLTRDLPTLRAFAMSLNLPQVHDELLFGADGAAAHDLSAVAKEIMQEAPHPAAALTADSGRARNRAGAH